MKKRFLSGLSLLLVLALLLPVLPVMAEESPCEHEWTEYGMCIHCEICCQHDQWNEGICTLCGAACDVVWGHQFDHNGVCMMCGLICSHEWDGYGTCTVCWTFCYHEQWEASVCVNCGAHCEHEWTPEGMCIYCETWCQHDQWNEGICTLCGAACDVVWGHQFDHNGVCMMCGLICSHEWDGFGTCTICWNSCYHEQWEEGVCVTCGYPCECRIYSDPYMYFEGVCYRCGTPCAHDFVDEVCTICNISCPHRWLEGGCLDCGKVCEHNYTDTICDICTAAAESGYACLSGEFNDWAFVLNMEPVTQRYLGAYAELESPEKEEFFLRYQGKSWGTRSWEEIRDEPSNAIDLVYGSYDTVQLIFPQAISGRYLFLLDTVNMELIVCYYPEQMYMDLGTGVLYPMETDGMGHFECTVTLGPGHYTVSNTDGEAYSYRWNEVLDLELNRTVDVRFSFRKFTYMGDDGMGYAAYHASYVPPCEHSWVDGTCEICAQVCTHKWGWGICTTCGCECEHEWTEDGMCIHCESWCDHEQFREGFCIVCGAQCGIIWDHQFDYYGVCMICGITCSHEWNDWGQCTVCGYYCFHDRWEEAVCTNCGYRCECRLYMDSYMYNQGVCYRCGTPCAHSYMDEVCWICNMPCPHDWMNGFCPDCGRACEHSFTDGVCDFCAAEEAKLGYACLSGEFNNWAYELNMIPMTQRHLGIFVELEASQVEEFSLYYQGKYWGHYSFSVGNIYCLGEELMSNQNLELHFQKPLSGRYLFLLDTVDMKLVVSYYPEQMYIDLGTGDLYPMETDGLGKFTCTVTLGPGQYTVSNTDGGELFYHWGDVFDIELTRTVDVDFFIQQFWYTGDDGINYGAGRSTYVPPCKHSWVDGTCEICAKVCTHKWEAGTCTTCGMVQVPVLSLKYPTVSFEDEVKMNIYFSAENTDGVEQMGLALYDSNPAQRSTEAAQLVEGYTYDEAAGLYCTATPGIAAKDLSDSLTFSVYALLKDGTYIYTNPITYSPQSYALSMVNNENADPALRSATVSMLSYSAAAQSYFGLEEGEPSVELTEEMLALIESYREDMLQGAQKADPEKLGAFAATGGFGRQYPTISFEGAFSINYYFAPSHTVEGDMKLYVWDRVAYESTEELTAENASKVLTLAPGTEYSAAVTDIAAKELDDTVYVAAVYSDGTNTHCSGVLAYSIGEYCRSQVSKGSESMQALAAAVAVYGYYARNYFG